MLTILYFQSSLLKVGRRIADGVLDFAARAGWRLHAIPYGNAAELEDNAFGNVRGAADVARLLAEWRPDGCIVGWSEVRPGIAKSIGDTPCVAIDDPDPGAAHVVYPDNAAIGRAAAAELLRLPLASCAHLSMHRPLYWSVERIQSFAAAVHAGGIPVFDLGDAGKSVHSVSERLVEALRRLPKPCGLFAVNDLVARRAAEAAEAAGLDVPIDLAIVGADDDESVCEGLVPTLSSVRPDFWRLGSEAAALLGRLMEQPKRKSALPPLRVGGETVVRRASSRRLLLGDPLVAATLEDIRLHYADPITAATLARGRGVCLRTLETRFRRAKGRTIGREISDTRFRAAQEMLSARERRSIEAIANFCGYDSDSTLRKAFRARLGLSPSAWRKTRCEGSLSPSGEV